MSLPLADPQFWIVTAAAVTALGFVLRRVFRRKSTAGTGALPCANCPHAGAPGHPGSDTGAGRRATVLLLALTGIAGLAGAEVVEREVAAMGTRLGVLVESVDRPTGLAVSEAIVAAVDDAERRLTTWRAASEIQSFNTAPRASRVALSPLVWNAMTTALACWEETGGAFDPTVAPLVEAWGLRHEGRLPTALEIVRALLFVDAGSLVLGRARHEIAQPGGVRIEEGGFGKGAALDAALAAARTVEPAARVALDFGGQLAWTGRPRAFEVRLADPRDRAQAVLALTLSAASGSLSTSGNSERRLVVDGVPVGHLLDPRSGRPAPDIGSATVFSAQATAADCRSTGLFVLGPKHGAVLMARWSRERQGEAVLLLVEPGGLRALVTPGLAAQARALTSEIRIETVGEFF